MLNNLTQNPDTQRRHALVRVYALLIRLVDEKESVSTQTVDSKTKNIKKAILETQIKDKKSVGTKQSKRVSQDTCPDAEQSRLQSRSGKPRTREKLAIS